MSVIVYEGPRGRVFRVKYRDSEGRQIQETLGRERDGWTRKRAEAELRERLVRVEQKGWRRPTTITFAQYADRWFAAGEGKRGWKPATVRDYEKVKERLVDEFGSMQLAAIRPRHVAAYVGEMSNDYAASTVHRDLSVLRSLLQSAQREELVETNAADRAERPKIPPFRPTILEPREVPLVAKAFTDQQAHAAFLVFVLAGLRRSELQNLRWRDVDLIEDVLHVRDSKTETGIRRIAIAPKLAEALWQWRRATRFGGDDERVFVSSTGNTYHAGTFKALLDATVSKAGIEKRLRIHDLRHTSITNDAAAGASAIAVMSRAGHASMSTTKRYLHLAGTVFRDEAAALEERLLASDHVPTMYPTPMTSDDPGDRDEAHNIT